MIELNTNELYKHIANIVKSNYSISIADFMSYALMHPLYGYYTTKNVIIGKAGDFITSPEISQLFGELIGVFFVYIWDLMNRPKNISIVDIGAGNCCALRDMLFAIKKLAPVMYECLTVHIVDARKKNIDNIDKDIIYNNSFSNLPKNVCFILANEFFDALPIYQFIYSDSGWREIRVWYDDKLHLVQSRPSSAIFPYVEKKYFNMHCGDNVEVCPSASNIVRYIDDHIASYEGIALIVDYGYRKNNYKNTLSAINNHRHVDIFYDIGRTDISAHVNFAEILYNIKKSYKSIYTQGHFLQLLGIKERVESLCRANINKSSCFVQSLKRLILPDCMGDLFKVVLIQSKKYF